MDGFIWLFAALGYVSGSIPFGILFTRAAGLGDVRAIGSGNIGATNVLRTGNKAVAALTLLADLLKGTFPVTFAFAAGGETAALAAGLGAFIGHLFPVWIGFKGGKGVATFIGILFGLAPIAGFMFIIVWAISALAFRISSLAALTATVAVGFFALIASPPQMSASILLMGLLIFWRHRENIARLRKGQEARINLSGKKT